MAKLMFLEGLPSGRRATHMRFCPSNFADISERNFTAANLPSMEVFGFWRSSFPNFHDDCGGSSSHQILYWAKDRREVHMALHGEDRGWEQRWQRIP